MTVERFIPIDIKYTDAKNKESVRKIMPVWIPKPKWTNVKAIDISETDDDTLEKMLGIVIQYTDYVDGRMNDILSFDDFTEQVTGTEEDLDFKWRTFAPERIEVLTEAK